MNRLLHIVSMIFVRSYFESRVDCTIDVNLGELEYIAAHLDPFECVRLIAALHYTTYELPRSIAAAERKVDMEIPCLRQLIHWNSSPSEGRGKTHEHIEHRLRQLNRYDLADWLGKTAFAQLGKDLEKSLEKPFGDLGEHETETRYPITLDPIEDEVIEEDPWLKVDALLMAFLVGLLATLVTLVVALVIHRIKLLVHRRKIDDARNDSKDPNEKRFSRSNARTQRDRTND